MARKPRSSAHISSNTTAGTAPPSVPSGIRRGARSSGRSHGRGHTRPARAASRGRGRSHPSSFIPSPRSVDPPTESPTPVLPEVTDDNHVAVAESSSPSTSALPASSSPSPLNTPPTITSVSAADPAPASEASSLTPPLPTVVNTSVTSPSVSLKSMRGFHSASKESRNRVSGARVSKAVRFISKATAEFPPPEITESYSPKPELSSKPDGHLYRNPSFATGYQPGGTRRLIFNYDSEVIGAQGALHHQAHFKVALGGGRFKPGKGTAPKRTQVVLYLKEDLNLEGIPVSLGVVFHKLRADNFMPIITVKGDTAAITAPLPPAGERFDPEDPDA